MLRRVVLRRARPQTPAGASPGTTGTSDAEWRLILTPEQFASLRLRALDPPFAAAAMALVREEWNVLACAGCHAPLFRRPALLELGTTGWLSFTGPIHLRALKAEQSAAAPAEAPSATTKKSLILRDSDMRVARTSPALLARETSGPERMLMSRGGRPLPEHRVPGKAKAWLPEGTYESVRKRSRSAVGDQPSWQGAVDNALCTACGGFIARLTTERGVGTKYVCNATSLVPVGNAERVRP